MEELLLNQDQAEKLTVFLKRIADKYSARLTDGDTGKIKVKSKDGRLFYLCYHYAIGNHHIQFFDAKTKLTLCRINMNDSFHKNADGSVIRGNRINVFSEREYYEKADGNTHTVAIPLPYSGIRNSDDFLDVLHDLLDYTNIHDNPKKLSLTIEHSLLS